MKKQRNIFRKGPLDFLRSAILPVIFTAAIMIAVISGIRQTDESGSAEGLRILEESLHRAVVMNYAIEGRYPQSLEYIVNNFGIHIDETRFIVHYTIFASNILPNITVIER